MNEKKAFPLRMEADNYARLLALAAEKSKQENRRVSMNEIINELINEAYKQLEINNERF